MILSRAAILAMSPDTYERMWRAMLQKEYGDQYRRIDAQGLDGLVGDTGFQLYHHQGGSWATTQSKFRNDFRTARGFRNASLREWIFISTFNFESLEQVNWLEQQIQNALPVKVQVWQQERLDEWSIRHSEIAHAFGSQSSTVVTQNVRNAAVVLGTNAICISGKDAVVLGPTAIRIEQRNS
jgi:hypothetical protein